MSVDLQTLTSKNGKMPWYGKIMFALVVLVAGAMGLKAAEMFSWF